MPLGFVVGLVVGFSMGEEAVTLATLAMLPVGFLVAAGVISHRLEMGFGTACLVELVQMVLGILVVGVIVAVIFAVLAGSGGIR